MTYQLHNNIYLYNLFDILFIKFLYRLITVVYTLLFQLIKPINYFLLLLLLLLLLSLRNQVLMPFMNKIFKIYKKIKPNFLKLIKIHFYTHWNYSFLHTHTKTTATLFLEFLSGKSSKDLHLAFSFHCILSGWDLSCIHNEHPSAHHLFLCVSHSANKAEFYLTLYSSSLHEPTFH